STGPALRAPPDRSAAAAARAAGGCVRWGTRTRCRRRSSRRARSAAVPWPGATRRGRARGRAWVCWGRRSWMGLDDLASQAQVPLRALALNVIQKRREPVRGSFAQANVARDHGAEDPEVTLHLFGHLVRQPISWIPHG